MPVCLCLLLSLLRTVAPSAGASRGMGARDVFPRVLPPTLSHRREMGDFRHFSNHCAVPRHLSIPDSHEPFVSDACGKWIGSVLVDCALTSRRFLCGLLIDCC